MVTVTISGVFYEPDGSVLPNARIKFIQQGNSANSFTQQIAIVPTDGLGNYSVTLYQGNYAVSLSVQGRADCFLGGIVIGNDSVDGTLNDYLITATPPGNALYEEMQRMYNETIAAAESAAISATESAASATSAAESVASIGDSVTVAENAAQAAANSATAAAESAASVGNSAEEAANSAASALTSSQKAASSATAASGSATSASSSATAAANSSNSASSSASAALTSSNSAASSATSAGNSASAAGTSATNSGASATAAANSATAAKTSETNSATSATNAANSASQAAAAVSSWEVAPYPDVWIPLNDGLQILAGFAPYDTITVNGAPVNLTTRSVTFSRATTATYIDKSGVLQTAAINEPRFEKAGLLIEGQSTNLMIISDDFITTQSGGKLAIYNTNLNGVKNADGSTTFTNNSSSPNTTGNAARRMLLSSSLTVAASTTYTLSIMGKGGTHQLTTYGTGVSNAGSIDVTFPEDKFGVVTTVVTSNASGGVFQCELYATPVNSDHSTYSGSFSLRYVQLEALPFATSYIPTSGAAVTRAPDNCSITSRSNILTDNCTIAATYDLLGPLNSVAGSVDRCICEFGAASGSSPRARIHFSYGLTKMVVFWGSASEYVAVARTKTAPDVIAVRRSGTDESMLIENAIKTVSCPSPLTAIYSQIIIGSSVNTNNAPLFGHIRNFRIWHTALTDAQLKSLR